MQQKKERLEKKQLEGALINFMLVYGQIISRFIVHTLVCVDY